MENEDGRQALQLTRATPEESAAWDAEQAQQRRESILEAAGACVGWDCGVRTVARHGFGCCSGEEGLCHRSRRTTQGGAGSAEVSSQHADAWIACTNPCDVCAAQHEANATRAHMLLLAAGFAAVFEAMRDSGKPAVGHNLGFDLAYSLYSFADSLPPSWQDYKAMVSVHGQQ